MALPKVEEVTITSTIDQLRGNTSFCPNVAAIMERDNPQLFQGLTLAYADFENQYGEEAAEQLRSYACTVYYLLTKQGEVDELRKLYG